MSSDIPTPPDAKFGFLLLAIVAILFSVIWAYQAARNEATAKAVVLYATSSGRGGARPETVSKQSAPKEFRVTTNWLWGKSIVGLTGGIVCFILYRKLDDSI